MRAEIRHLHSPDIADLARYWPEEPDNFGFLLQLLAGPEGEPGEESFDFLVCTPRWLTETYSADEIVDGRHTLIMFEYDYPRLAEKLSKWSKTRPARTGKKSRRNLVVWESGNSKTTWTLKNDKTQYAIRL